MQVKLSYRQKKNKAYYLRHREEILAQTQQYRLENIERVREYDRQRNAPRNKRWYGEVRKILTNPNGCEICGELRTLDLAHIIARNGSPVRWYDRAEKDNLLTLCPTHHRLFDENKLSEGEYAKIAEKVPKARMVLRI